MRIVSRTLILFCLIDVLRGQSSAEDGQVPGDFEWWSERITRINGKEQQQQQQKQLPTIGLLGEDSGRRDDNEVFGSSRRPEDDSGRREDSEVFRSSRRRWDDVPGTRESRGRSRPAGDSRGRPESRRRNNRVKNHEAIVGELFDWERSGPSPILLPPYATSTSSSSDSRVNQKERNQEISIDAKGPRTLWKNESSPAGKPPGSSSALEQIRIYEITTFNSTSGGGGGGGGENAAGTISNAPRHRDDSSRIEEDVEEESWTNVERKSSVNTTRSQPRDDRGGRNSARSFYINEPRQRERDEKRREREQRTKPTRGRAGNRSPKNPRGNGKYQRGFESERSYGGTRELATTTTAAYEWQQRRPTARRSNRLRISDSNVKVGAVPGVPGRDYPVHQEHTHHNLRNVADRFPCPQTPKTHVYLADRASRCQIFYVCYGSKTGVPMVCPNGTLFSEPLQVCDWWFNVPC